MIWFGVQIVCNGLENKRQNTNLANLKTILMQTLSRVIWIRHANFHNCFTTATATRGELDSDVELAIQLAVV